MALAVVLVDRRAVLYPHYLDRAVLRPMLRFGLPFVPSRLALWGLNLSNRLFLLAFSTQAAVGVLALGVRIGTSVALVVTAFQLAWPPFAYSIQDDDEARRVYRSVLTWWCVLASWLVLGLALLHNPLLALLGHRWEPAANPMALVAARLRLLRRLLRPVGVAVGRVKEDQPSTGSSRASHDCERDPVHDPDPAVRPDRCGRERQRISYLITAVLMIVRGERRSSRWATGASGCRARSAGGVVFAAADRLPTRARPSREGC